MSTAWSRRALWATRAPSRVPTTRASRAATASGGGVRCAEWSRARRRTRRTACGSRARASAAVRARLSPPPPAPLAVRPPLSSTLLSSPVFLSAPAPCHSSEPLGPSSHRIATSRVSWLVSIHFCALRAFVSSSMARQSLALPGCVSICFSQLLREFAASITHTHPYSKHTEYSCKE